MQAIKCAFILAIVLLTAAGSPGADKSAAKQEQETAAIVKGNTEFALRLYAKLRAEEGNLFFSPYSISTALAMAYGGARGQTAEQMAEVLCFPTVGGGDPNKGSIKPATQPWPEQRFHSAFGTIVRDLNAKGAQGGFQLSVANALWGQKGYEFLTEFIELTKVNYDGRLSEVDFITAAESARNIINRWVEKETNNKIKNLIQKGVLNSMTRLVLTNAIYFKGDWESQFEKDRTKDAPFTLLNGDKIDAAMMNQTGRFNYMEAKDFQALELPYAEGELSMIILLPKKVDGLREFEKSLTADKLSRWLEGLARRKVIVSVPKFTMTSQFSLAEVLKSMGMTDAFSGRADFSAINGRRDLFISAVIHKAFVEVNEEGTEAAAATAVAVSMTSIGPQEIPVFRADHPFLFLIRDNCSQSVLFLGRVENPSQ